MRKLVSTAHDYIVTYGKNTENLSNAINKVRLTERIHLIILIQITIPGDHGHRVISRRKDLGRTKCMKL